MLLSQAYESDTASEEDAVPTNAALPAQKSKDASYESDTASEEEGPIPPERYAFIAPENHLSTGSHRQQKSPKMNHH
jgi:hypothetical protein